MHTRTHARTLKLLALSNENVSILPQGGFLRERAALEEGRVLVTTRFFEEEKVQSFWVDLLIGL